MILDQFPAIRAMSIDEKVALLSEIMGDISRSEPPLAPAHQQLLDDRLQDQDGNRDSILTHQRFLERFDRFREQQKARFSGA